MKITTSEMKEIFKDRANAVRMMDYVTDAATLSNKLMSLGRLAGHLDLVVKGRESNITFPPIDPKFAGELLDTAGLIIIQHYNDSSSQLMSIGEDGCKLKELVNLINQQSLPGRMVEIHSIIALAAIEATGVNI